MNTKSASKAIVFSMALALMAGESALAATQTRLLTADLTGEVGTGSATSTFTNSKTGRRVTASSTFVATVTLPLDGRVLADQMAATSASVVLTMSTVGRKFSCTLPISAISWKDQPDGTRLQYASYAVDVSYRDEDVSYRSGSSASAGGNTSTGTASGTVNVPLQPGGSGKVTAKIGRCTEGTSAAKVVPVVNGGDVAAVSVDSAPILQGEFQY
ncbi:hypothetical protein [Methylococcus mesophilus]|uniref:hypothetical protein n=1 Tax=Methylococcus mesophilus TaxID=2993564 RepID=UPI00224ACD45|nr:hypothetical protein [Methylococcus mesophilus]UZR29705.1 hypothetical protein OOT43_03465 [Methylococcus mesophilus]